MYVKDTIVGNYIPFDNKDLVTKEYVDGHGAVLEKGYFSVKGKGTATITLPAKFDNYGEYDVDIFYFIETVSNVVEYTCIYEMRAEGKMGMTKDSNGHWTKQVDYILKERCVKDGLSNKAGDVLDMSGYVYWLAFVK